MLHYFAYGSNMLPARLRQPNRAPSARLLGIGALAGRELSFEKHGRDDSGKCDARSSRDASERVWGGIFAIDPNHRRSLDVVEGLGVGYTVVNTSVQLLGGGHLEVFFYEALETRVGLRPFDWYLQIVRAGAQELGLPPSYRARLERVDAVPDPDPARARAQYAGLGLPVLETQGR